LGYNLQNKKINKRLKIKTLLIGIPFGSFFALFLQHKMGLNKLHYQAKYSFGPQEMEKIRYDE